MWSMWDAPSDRDYYGEDPRFADDKEEMPYEADALFCTCGHHRTAHYSQSSACKFCNCTRYTPRTKGLPEGDCPF